MNGGRLESEALIESTGFLVLRVSKDRTYAGDVSGLKRAQESILQQTPADFLPLMINVNSKPGKNHHRNGMPCQSFPDSRRRGSVINRTNCQAVIADNLTPQTHDKGLSRVGLLVALRSIPELAEVVLG